MEESLRRAKRKFILPAAEIAAGYAVVILAGAILLVLPFSARSGRSVGFLTSLFTAASAVSTTGLVVVDTFTTFSLFGQIVVFLLVQLGGLGFMTAAALLFLIAGKKMGLAGRLAMSESFATDGLSGLFKIAKNIIFLTFIIELAGFAAGLPFFIKAAPSAGLGIWFSLFHSVASFCNAGFDLAGGAGISGFVGNPLFNIVTVTLMFLGGLGFTVFLDLKKNLFMRGRRFSLNTKIVLKANVFLIVFGALLIFFGELHNPDTLGSLSFGEKIYAALFHAVSPRSAGFAVIDPARMNAAGFTVTMALMFIGGSPASTAGGIQVTTFVVLLAAVWAAVRSREDITLNKTEISRRIINKAFTVAGCYAVTLFTSVLVLGLSEGGAFGFGELLFESVSALSTSGLSAGITASLSVTGKLTLIVLMYLGRAGFLCIAHTFAGTQGGSAVKYPEGKLYIG